MTETVSKDTARGGRQCEQDRQTRPTQRKGGGHTQDIAREHQQGPPHKRTRTPPRRSEGWNVERLRRGLKLRNKREIGVVPLKGKNQRERLELSQTRCRTEGHSKRAGSHRAQRESSGRGRSPSIQIMQSTKDNLQAGGGAVQVAMEVNIRSGKNKGEIQELPKTRNLSEDH